MNHDPAQLLAQADKAYSSAGSGFSFFGSKTEKLENAAALYIQAANAYKKNKESAVPGGFVTPEQKEVGRQAGMAFEKVLSPPLSLDPTPKLSEVLTSTPRPL